MASTIHQHESVVSSVQFSLSAVFDSLRPHGLQHARLPCLSPTPRACSDSCSSSPWCHPTISSSAFNLCQCQVLFQWVSSSHQVAKVLELQLHSPSNEYSRLISFRMDWFDLLAVQGTLILQQHSSKASILAVEIHKSQPSQSPFPHAPHPSPLGCHRAPVAHFLLPTADSHWLSMLCMVMYMFPYYSPKSSHLLLPHCDCKSVFCICVTSAAPQTGSSVPYF